jgi:hypothetical protein
VFFKNAIDCIIIDIPLSDISPEISEIVDGDVIADNSLQPRVISTIPNKQPRSCDFVIPILETSGKIVFVIMLNTFKIVKSSENR